MNDYLELIIPVAFGIAFLTCVIWLFNFIDNIPAGAGL
jgi:hypothetical protein